MKKLCLLIVGSLIMLAGTAWAGSAKVLVFHEVSGVTVGMSSGTSRVCVIDLKQVAEIQFGLFSITYPHGGMAPDGQPGISPITFGDTTATADSTGGGLNSGVTVPYFYIVTDTPKSASEIESIGESGVTAICALPVGSSSTPYQMQQFLPEPGRYLHILVGSSTTNYHRPGVYVGIN